MSTNPRSATAALHRARCIPAFAERRGVGAEYGSERLWWGALLAISAALVLPLFLCEAPPLGDYPNHLARAFVLASLPGDPVLARFYAPHWSVIPNLGLDLLMPPLIGILPVHVAGRLIIGAAVLLTFLGAVAYGAALAGREGRWWRLGAGLAAWNSCLFYGFLNFSLSLGLAFLLGAAWLRWRDQRLALCLALAIPGAVALFACHLMGLLFFAVLAGSAELATLGRSAGGGLARRAGILAIVFAAPASLYCISGLNQLGGDAEWISFHDKLVQLVTTFTNYNGWLDHATAALAVAVPAASLLLRRGRFPAPAAVAVTVLLVTYFAAPFSWKGTYLLDTRLSTMLGLMMFAGFAPGQWPRAVRVLCIPAIGILFAVRMGVLTEGFLVHNEVVRDLRAALAPVQPGQAVFIADAGPDEAPGYWAADPYWLKLSNGVPLSRHLGALALIEHRAWWPFEFDIPSQQPIRTLPPYAALAERTGSLPDVRSALKMDLCGFDLLLVTNAKAVPRLPGSRFRLVRDAGFAALYAITDCGGQ